MNVRSRSWSRSFFIGLVVGAGGWIAYGIVEFVFCSLVPLLLWGGYVTSPWHWKWTATLFCLYALSGSILGGILAIVLRTGQQTLAPDSEFAKRLNTLVLMVLVLAFAAGMAAPSALPQSYYSLFVVCPALGLLLVLTARSKRLPPTMAVMTGPWVVSVLLVSPFTLFGDGNPTLVVKVAGNASFLATIVLLSVAAGKFTVIRQALAAPPSTFRGALVLGMVMLALLGSSLILSEKLETEWQAAPPHSPDAAPPSVLLLVMDTVRADHLSAYGYSRNTSPYLRRLANEATLYKRAISTSDMTLGSHASIFTGQYAHLHGAHYAPPNSPNGRPLDRRFQTLAEALSTKGYVTLAVSANHAYVTPDFGLDQGFQLYDNRPPVPIARQDRYLRHAVRRVLSNFLPTQNFDHKYRQANEINQDVFRLLDSISNDPRYPFFLFLNYMDAHEPYAPPPPFDTLFPGKNRRLTADDYDQLCRQVNNQMRRITQEEQDHFVSQYDGAIAFLDSQIGKLLSRLKELGLYDKSLIIVTSDHGESFGRRDLMEHGVSVYQELIHVPLIVKYPEQKQGRVVDTLVSGVDLLPTVLELANCRVANQIQGRSLKGLEGVGDRHVFSESFFSDPLTKPYSRFHRIERAVLSGSMKFITSTAGKRELYDLRKDPNEEVNLHGSEHNQVIAFSTALEEFLKVKAPQMVEPGPLPRKTLERLRTLGYIQ